MIRQYKPWNVRIVEHKLRFIKATPKWSEDFTVDSTEKFDRVSYRVSYNEMRQAEVDLKNKGADKVIMGMVYYPLRGIGKFAMDYSAPSLGLALIGLETLNTRTKKLRFQTRIYYYDPAKGYVGNLSLSDKASWQTPHLPDSNKFAGLMPPYDITPPRKKSIYGLFDAQNFESDIYRVKTETEPYKAQEARHFASDLHLARSRGLDYIEPLPKSSWQSGDLPNTAKFGGRGGVVEWQPKMKGLGLPGGIPFLGDLSTGE